MEGGAREPGRSVMSKVFAVLTAFDENHRRLTTTGIAVRSGLPLSTAHRLVRDLESRRALIRDARGGYRIGHLLWELAQLAPSPLRDTARPLLQDLFDQVYGNVHLAIRAGTDVIYTDRLYDSAAAPRVARVGSRLPLHTTGVGLALLAHQSERFVDAYLSRVSQDPSQVGAVDRDRLRTQLAEIRTRGYVTAAEQADPGSRAVAAPVWDDEHQLIAAIGVVLGGRRRGDLVHVVKLLLHTTDALHAALSHPGMPTASDLRWMTERGR